MHFLLIFFFDVGGRIRVIYAESWLVFLSSTNSNKCARDLSFLEMRNSSSVLVGSTFPVGFRILSLSFFPDTVVLTVVTWNKTTIPDTCQNHPTPSCYIFPSKDVSLFKNVSSHCSENCRILNFHLVCNFLNSRRFEEFIKVWQTIKKT
jgi:hypothetical protein